MSIAVARGTRLRGGRYELTELLGRGGAATVWLGRDTLLERPVAVKVLSEGLLEDEAWLARFRREAQVAARLSHLNLVSIFDFEAEGERPYLVMDYMPGGTLADRVDGGRPGTSTDPEALARDVLAALEHIHQAGVIHRDIKPENVLFARDGSACLGDFGVARPEDSTAITQTGQMPGTARYMAPELWRGEPASERSDLYSLGVLLSPWVDEGSPPRLVALVDRLAAEERELRPGSAADALAMLDEPGTSLPPLLPPDAGPVPSRTPGRLAVLALAAAAVGAVLATTIGGGDDPDSAPDRPAAQRQNDSDPSGGGAGSTADQIEPEPAAPAVNAASAAELDSEGKALIDAGRPEEAIPILERAVAAAPEDTDTYAFALFNLGNALRLSGRPEEAIPILERRLQIPNQTDVVAAELEAAKRTAGADD